MKMNKVLAWVAAFGMSSALWAGSVQLHNQDSHSYRYLSNSSESCFSGTHSSISSNTVSSVSSGWFCLHEEKPAVYLQEGKKYKIKNGKVMEQ